MNINWEKKIKIDTKWTNRQLVNHFSEKAPKIVVRAYTPKVTGTKFCCNALVSELGFLLPDYALSEKSKKNKLKSLTIVYGKELAKDRYQTALYQEAQAFFGKKDPTTDGKYGELLLFALCESVLKSKMVAHKIEGLSNGKDQVKGGDGIFLGNYELGNGKMAPAIFIGESKIMQERGKSIDEALESLNRFHDAKTQAEFNKMEFIVANRTLSLDENDIDYEEVYERLTPGSEMFKKQITVHPILLMYNTANISKLETKAIDRDDLEALISAHLIQKKDEIINLINEKLEKYPEIKKVYVDFFCFPFNDIDTFRNGMYFNIHKVAYTK
ncbi:HamA C-terminal domain-containing protein [Myroides sp. C4067]|uniref:HamA C-terminal domain-containing protein n=1 Tax=Myroides sp. C4067 TaxID=3136765 RepID=UPI0031011CA7